MVHQTRGAFSFTQEERQIEKYDKQIDSVQERLQKRFRGREYIASLASKGNRTARDGPETRFRLGQVSVSSRDEIYRRAGPLGRAKIEIDAKREKRRRDAEVSSELEHVQHLRQLALARRDSAANQSDGILNTVSSFRLKEEDFEDFDKSFEKNRQNIPVGELVSMFDEAPRAPVRETRELLEEAMTDEGERAVPGFVRHISRNRDFFLSTRLSLRA